MTNERKRIKCEGRFSELRTFIYSEAVPIVLEDRTTIGRNDLEQIWGLVENDIPNFDLKDPYYNSRIDTLRKNPKNDYLSLVPLVGSTTYVSEELVRDYSLSMGNSSTVADRLATMARQPRKFLQEVLEREPRDIVFSSDTNLAGYRVSGNFGIGVISDGGTQGGGIRSDSPFLIEIYKQPKDRLDLVSVVGFWAQDNNLLVSQLQSCKNGHFPSDIPFGVGSLRVAEVVARGIGFDNILVYSARSHPIFKEHPENWKQFGPNFVCMWDNSAKKLNFDGTRNSHYEKSLK